MYQTPLTLALNSKITQTVPASSKPLSIFFAGGRCTHRGMATYDHAATPTPQSPGVGGVPFSSCIGDLLRFVLSSHAAAYPGDDTVAFPLSPSYCARLLNDGELFEKLEACIQQCLEEGRLPGPPAVVGIPAEEEGPEERGWKLLLPEKGAELKRVIRLFLASVPAVYRRYEP